MDTFKRWLLPNARLGPRAQQIRTWFKKYLKVTPRRARVVGVCFLFCGAFIAWREERQKVDGFFAQRPRYKDSGSGIKIEATGKKPGEVADLIFAHQFNNWGQHASINNDRLVVIAKYELTENPILAIYSEGTNEIPPGGDLNSFHQVEGAKDMSRCLIYVRLRYKDAEAPAHKSKPFQQEWCFMWNGVKSGVIVQNYWDVSANDRVRMLKYVEHFERNSSRDTRALDNAPQIIPR